MAKADILAGRAYVSLFVKKSDFTKALDSAKKDLQDFGTKLIGVGAAVSGMGSAIVGSMTGALLHFASVGDELDKMSLRTGVSATALAELGFAAEQSGTNLDSVESALKRMARNLGDIGPEGAKTTAALEAIGLSSENIKSLSPEDQFQLIAERIGGIEDPTKKAAAAMAIFGEGGRQLLPMMESIKELRQEAKDLGIAPSQESVAAAAQITDAINRVRRVIGAAIFEVGAAIAPMAADVLGGFLKVVSAVRRFIVENKALIVTAAKVGATLMIVGGAIVGIGTVFVGVGAALGLISTAIAGFATAIGAVISVGALVGTVLGAILSPVGLLVVALGAAVFAWARFTESGRTAVSTLVSSVTGLFTGLRQTVTDTMGGIVEAVRAGDLALAGQIAMVGLKLVFAQGLEAIHGLFGETIGGLVGQILSGDFAGAWATVGSAILDTMAQVASGIVGVFTRAINAITDMWASGVNKLTNMILEFASQGGLIGEAFKAVTGVDMQAETKRAAKLEAQMRAAGMNTGGDDISKQIASGTYRDPGVEAIRQQIQGITSEIDAGRQAVTEATGQALTDATAGTTGEVSASVMALQKQLAALREEASAKLAEGKDGTADAKPATSTQDESRQGLTGRASAATNNLMSLQAMASGPQDKQTRLAEQQLKKQDKSLEKQDLMIAAIESLGWNHS
jgi:hypothetical protein